MSNEHPDATLRALRAAAFALPLASPEHFIDPANFYAATPPRLRLIDDPSLRKQLIALGLATPAESVRGRPRRVSVLLLSTTHLDAIAPPEKSMDPRRRAYRDDWDRRLCAVLTEQFQWSVDIAKALCASPATVLERLGDMTKRGLAERQVIRFQIPRRKANRKARQHSRQLRAHFRLPPQKH